MMMRLRVLREIALTTFREFIRTPEAVFWTYGFPVIMAMVLGLAFSSQDQPSLPVVVVSGADGNGGGTELAKVLAASERLDVSRASREEAEYGFRNGRYLVLLTGTVDAPRMRIDPVRPNAELAGLYVQRVFLDRERNALSAARGNGPPSRELVQIERTSIPGSRYIDFLIPGLIGLNLLGAGMWGVGFNVVRMRDRKMLRRLMVTPMRKLEFLFSFMLSRLVLVVPDAVLIVGFGMLVFDVPVLGSFWTLLLIVGLGGFCFMGLGLLVASRTRTTEGVSGLMNLVMVPMWLLGGSFFSTDHFPDVMQWLVNVLPITHANNAMRAIMLEGEGFLDVLPELAFLFGFGAVCLGAAVRVFRWS